MNRSAISYALLSAALFGLATPLAKALVSSVDAWMLAGLLYAGSGVGLGFLRLLLRRRERPAEASLSRRDTPWLAAAILAGGVAGPVLLMVGLQRTDASAASLLLTVEGVATALIAWFVFRENFDRRIAVGMGCIVAGAAVLAWPQDVRVGGIGGPLAIIAACVAWALDNNFTRKVSLADPIQIAMLKGLIAAPVTIGLALINGADLPGPLTAGLAALVGFFGYGVSLVLFVYALRGLGTARTGAYFSTAPFLGAVASVGLLGEPVSMPLVTAGFLMAVGVWLHLTERHEHTHEHAPAEHTHSHSHDVHHKHGHGPGDPIGEPHSHRHIHTRLWHRHAHVPDSHHQHSH